MTKERKAQYRGLRPEGPKLAEGEKTVAVRLRGPAPAVDAFAALTPAERTAVIVAWYASLTPNNQ